MFVHVDSQFFIQRPRMSLILCVVLMILFWWLWWQLYTEYRDFAPQPEVVDLAKIAPPPSDHGRWIHPTSVPPLDCFAVKMKRTWPESWFFGEVEASYYRTQIVPGRWLVVHSDGDVSCADAASRAAKGGVIEGLNPRMRDTLNGNGMSFPPTITVLKLCTECGPSESRKLLIEVLFFPILLIVSMVYLWPRYLALKKLEESPFTYR